jgi:hypothetical protein
MQWFRFCWIGHVMFDDARVVLVAMVERQQCISRLHAQV